MDRSDFAAFAGGGGRGAAAVDVVSVDQSQLGRSREETLEYVSVLVEELRGLVERTGSERLATLLALAQFEVRGQLSKVRDLKRP